MDFDDERIQILETAQVAQSLVERLAGLNDQGGLLHRHLGRRLDAVEDEGVGYLFDQIEDVVQAADQGVDLLAVEGRDEGRLQAVAYVVADLASPLLGVADLRFWGYLC